MCQTRLVDHTEFLVDPVQKNMLRRFKSATLNSKHLQICRGLSASNECRPPGFLPFQSIENARNLKKGNQRKDTCMFALGPFLACRWSFEETQAVVPFCLQTRQAVARYFCQHPWPLDSLTTSDPANQCGHFKTTQPKTRRRSTPSHRKHLR